MLFYVSLTLEIMEHSPLCAWLISFYVRFPILSRLLYRTRSLLSLCELKFLEVSHRVKAEILSGLLQCSEI